ncbi:MAG TPA: hypothetical protein VM243_18910 [Phycisphaerae bacterium]|nr:hypothetical protein [Phycisphaerae bacterium]
MGARRVILKPAGISDHDASRLAEALHAAVVLQQELAAWSPHVLRFLGRLRETEDGSAYFVEHEPAVVTPAANPFDPDSPRVEQPRLFQLSAALMHALHTIHRSEREGANAHGGLCPGVVLLSADQIVKLTDFGFAGAFCATLGAESYLNLAVRPGAEGVDDTEVTGTWQVLPDHDFDRDDRICAFVDPEKYRTGNTVGFEPGSDVIAAAFLLYLWSQGHHPYLRDYPDAHRLVGMSEFMTKLIYRRYGQSFRDSQDPTVQRWAELLDRMLARLPKDRPSAAEVALGLAEVGITPDKNAKLPTPKDVQVQKKRATRPPKKRAGAFAAVAAVVVLGAAGAIFGLWPRDKTDRQGATGPAGPAVTRPEDAAQLAQPADNAEPDDLPPPSPLAGAVAQLRGVLSESAVLAPAADRLVPDQDGGGQDPPVISYQFAGLPQPERSLNLANADTDEGPTLSSDQIQTVRSDVAQLETLLRLDAEPTELIADLTAGWADQPLGNLLDRTRIRLRPDAPPVWRLSTLNDRWRADDVPLRVVFTPASDAADAAPDTDLAPITLGLRLIDGQISAARLLDGDRADLQRAVSSRLLELQNASLQQRTQELTEATASINAEIAANPAMLAAASGTAQLTASAQGLRPRTFSLTWSPGELHFAFAPTQGRRVEDLLLAHAAVPAFNRKLPPDHWIRQVSAGDAFEASEPTDGRWTIAIPALWAPQGIAAEQLDSADVLPIPVPWPADLRDPEAIADLALATEAPPYWALLDDYRRYAGDPFFMAGALRGEATVVVDAVERQRFAGSPMETFLSTRPQYILPRTELSGEPALRAAAPGAAPTALDLPVRASWTLQNAPPGVDRDQLTAAVQGLAALPQLSVTLNLSADNRVQLTGVSGLVNAFEPSRPGAAALEERIGLLGARQTLDAELQRLLPQGAQQTPLADNALDILRRIWRAKGAPERADLGDLQALSAALRDRGGLRFDKTPPGQSEAILPSVFVEFFCGPQFCYAVTWSAGNDTLSGENHVTVDPPTLLQLCPSQEVFAVVRGDAGARADTLGGRLFAPVFAAAPQAIGVLSEEFFTFYLGLVLAFDDALWLLPSVETLSFAGQETYLRDIVRAESVERSKRWATLQELRDGNSRSDFALVSALSSPPPPVPPGAGERSAIETLVRATAP